MLASGSDRFDVAVVGAGPGGATAVEYLSRAGARTLLIDKAHFPRDKSCGDAVCSKSISILRELGLDRFVEAQVFARCEQQTLFSPGGHGLRLPFLAQAPQSSGAPGGLQAVPAYVIRRELFDDVLFQHARRQQGVTALEEAEFVDFMREDGCVMGLRARAGGQYRDFRASIVIGADGAMSKVAACAGAYDFKHKHHDHWIAAFRIYYEGVKDLGPDMEIHFVHALLPGYFWIFPVGGGRANVGAGMVESSLQEEDGKRKDLRRATYELIASHPRFRERFADARELPGSFRGWQLPCGSERRPIAGNGWMLIGDAASLIDPFSGEGIANAMHSGKLAAEHAARALREGTAGSGGLRPYERQVWEELGPELKNAYKMQRMLRHRWLLDFVVQRAATRPRVHQLVLDIVADREKAKQLTRPWFYLKLPFL